MERLTYRSPRFNNPVSNGACEKIKCSAKCDSCKINDLIAKLCAYEDTGIEPEEIYEVRFLIAAQRDPQKLARLRELVQAEQDGRLVVLPCKVGDTIWRIKCLADWPDIGKPYVEADAFLYRDIHYFGKTVFLTREEAEAALAQKGGKNE